MSDLKDPTQTEFTSAETAIRDLMTSNMPSIITKAGSVVREIIVRPMAYIYSAIRSSVSEELDTNSAKFLLTSSATDTEAADAIAANYFTTRLAEIPASGVITMEFASPVLALSQDIRLYADGVELTLPVGYVATTSSFVSEDPTIVYVKAYKSLSSDGSVVYTASFPVNAASGSEVGVGAEVDITPVIDYVSSAWVSSPITGGRGVETDAELLTRCAEATANAGIGSLYGVSRMLKASPYAVLDLNVAFGDTSLVTRGRYNTVNVNPGGFVDCYVKTANQPPAETLESLSSWISVTEKETDSGNAYEYTIDIPASSAAGVLAVNSVYAGDNNVGVFTTEFGADTTELDAESARLSAHQTLKITFTSAYADLSDIRVNVSRMPRVRELSEYVKEDANRFVGQDILVKCAVPISVSMQCVASADNEEQLDAVKDHIVSIINQKRVGDCSLNFSDIRKSCADNVPGVDLRLPCSFTCVTTTKAGGRLSMTTETGIFSMEGQANDQWESTVSFLSTSRQNIRISIL